MSIQITVDFSSGVSTLFDNLSTQDLSLPDTFNMSDLLEYLAKMYLKKPHEEFLAGKTVRPGIMVVINEVDWELLGSLEYKLQDCDRITFISTLHGG